MNIKRIIGGGIRAKLALVEEMLGKLFIKMNSRIYVRQFRRYLRDLGFDPEEKCEGDMASMS